MNSINVLSSSLNLSLNRSSAQMAKSVERLSTGNNVNKASDDTTVTSRLTKFNTQVGGLSSANKNINDAVSFTMTAGAALEGVKQNALNIRDLAVEYKNGAASAEDKARITESVRDNILAIQYAFNHAEYNGNNVLKDGRTYFQVGKNDGDVVSVKSTAQSVYKMVDVPRSQLDSIASDFLKSEDSLKYLDNAVKIIDSNISEFASVQNRLGMVAEMNTRSIESAKSGISNIQEVDMAKEIANITKQQISQQVISSMMGTVNDQRSLVLNLLR